MRQADRLIINVLSNYALTLVGGIASLIVVPIVTHDLGLSGYGLATMLLATFTITTTFGNAINRAMQRFVPLDLANPDPRQISITFNSGMALYAILGLISAIVIWSVKFWYLDDPALSEELRRDGALAFALVSISLVIGSPLFAYRACLEAIQRFDLVGFHVSAATVLRMLVVIAFFKLDKGSVAVFAISQVVATIASCYFCRKALFKAIPALRESPSLISPVMIKGLTVFAGATLLAIAGNVLGLEGFRVLVGMSLGMEEVGGLSAVWTVRSMVFLLITSMTNVLTPAASDMDARGASDTLAKLLLASTKYATVAAASTCVVPLTIAAPLLTKWLGDDVKGYGPLLFLVMITQVPLAASMSAQQVLIGMGRMKVTGPLMFMRGAGSLAAAWLYMWGAREPSLFGATLVLYAFQVFCSIVLFAYGAAQTRLAQGALFLEGFCRPIALGFAGTLVTWAVAGQLGTGQWWRLMTAVGAGELVYLGLLLTLGLGTEERVHLHSFFLRAKNRLMPGTEADELQ